MLEALKIAALSGVDVRIIIPAKPDHPFVYWCSLDYLGELLDAGVRCFEYTRGFTHAKLMTVDGKITSIGTANMDIRSFKLNFEINAFIYDEKTTLEFEKQFEEDFSFSNEITKEVYEKRSAAVRVKEAFSRLISPLL
jgi:cardiolipin synthase